MLKLKTPIYHQINLGYSYSHSRALRTPGRAGFASCPAPARYYLQRPQPRKWNQTKKVLNEKHRDGKKRPPQPTPPNLCCRKDPEKPRRPSPRPLPSSGTHNKTRHDTTRHKTHDAGDDAAWGTRAAPAPGPNYSSLLSGHPSVVSFHATNTNTASTMCSPATATTVA